MALPIIETPTYELTLPSQDEIVKYRPFLVKEEKLMLIALESGEEKEINIATKTILDACTFNKLKIEDLPTFDIEYMFLQIRAKSVGEISRLSIKCPDDNETLVEVDIDLSKIECHKEVGHNNNIKITDDVGLILNYPNVDTMKSLDNNDETGATFDVITSCISQIYDADNVYAKNDMDKEELNDFIESMSHIQF